MNVNVPELLMGALAALSTPPAPEAAGEFAAGRVGVVGLLLILAAQEAEHGVAMRVEENRAIRALLRRALAERWLQAPGADLDGLAGGEDGELTLTAVDLANADLRRALIAVQAEVESTPGRQARERERAMLDLLRTAAERRRLELPGAPAA